MVRHGFPVNNLRFDWDDSIDYTPEQQVAYETMIADRYDVDPKYFAEKYSMPVGDRRNPTAPIDPDNGDDPGNVEDDNDTNNPNNPNNPKAPNNPNAPQQPTDPKNHTNTTDTKAKNARSFFD